jgi:nuclear pore complex protein Nup205
MSLFMRMAQTKAGAERLLECHLITTLARCDYIDARPESDQAFIGKEVSNSI